MSLFELSSRLAEARESGKLNLSYFGAGALDDALKDAIAAGIRIIELDLSSNDLTADTLPRGLAAFPHLRALHLKYNCLASLPSLAQLPRLEHLDLDSNQITAIKEVEAASLPSNLQRLSLASNGLASLPDGIGVTCCRKLTWLSLSNNPLTTLPDSLGSCPTLTYLDVSSCRLSSLPFSLSQCRTLQRFFCQNNDLQKVPTAFGHLMGTLKEWNLRSNRLPLKYEQAKERGLAKFLAFLREEEEVERLEEIERNRPVGVASGPCTIYRCKAVLDDALLAEQAGEPTSGFAWIRHGYAACQHRNSVYVWGGVVVREGRKTSELLVLNTDTMEWRAQPTRGERPCPRDGHSMVVDDLGRHLLVFGGRKEAGGRRLAELHFLDLSSFTWFAPKIDSTEAPCTREQCSAAYAQGSLLIFGGRTNGARLNDLWAFCTTSFRWEQLPIQGTVPAPRQGAAACVHDGKLWVMGGQANFVLDDLFTYKLDTQEWQAVTIAGRSKAAARSGGHILAVHEGTMFMYGGRDALGAQVSHLLKLKKAGGARYEWVETEFCLLPNRSRVVLFDRKGRLCICQSGHPLHQLNVDPHQIEAGSVIWDVTQLVPLSAVKDKVLRDDASRTSPKQERIHHVTLIAAKLPPPFSSHTLRERQLLTAAAAFRQRWIADAQSASRLPACVALLNECGVEKVVCTTLRPARLPHVELHDLQGICQFVADFFTCEPLQQPGQAPTHLVSPWTLLEWQAGDSFDLATFACSLLLGAGYNAYVVVGYAPKQVAMGDQSCTECPYIKEYGLEAPAHEELPETEASFELEPEPLAAAVSQETEQQAQQEGQALHGAAAAAAASGSDSTAEGAGTTEGTEAPQSSAATREPTVSSASRPGTGTTPAPQLAPLPAADMEVAAAHEVGANVMGEQDPSPSADEERQPPPVAAHRRGPKRYVHAFVLIKPGRRDVCQPLLLDPFTGCQYSVEEAPCTGIEFAWNASNFWCNLQRNSGATGAGGSGSVSPRFDGVGGENAEASAPTAAADHGLLELELMDWNFCNPNCWLPLLMNKEEQYLEAGSVVAQLSMHSKLSGDAPLHRLSDSRPSHLLGRNPSIFATKGFSPLNLSLAAAEASPVTLGGAVPASSTGTASTPDIPGSGGGKGSVGLQLLATAHGGTPHLGSGWLRNREIVDPSLPYLSPDQPSVAQRACTQKEVVAGGSSAAPLYGTSAAAPCTRPPSQLGPPGTACSLGRVATAAPASLPPQPEMPLSWVPTLTVSRERLDSRCPHGEKAVQYRHARREIYARFGECTRWDGLVERLTTYADPECTIPLCVLEIFERRKDGLVRRQVQAAQRTSIVTLQPGAASCLRTLRTCRPSGQLAEVEMVFNHDARPDGLMRRLSSRGHMEEWFLPGSRPDRLLHRTVRYAGTSPTPSFNATARMNSDAAAILAAAASAADGRCSLRLPTHRSSLPAPNLDALERAVACIHEQFGPPLEGAEASARGASANAGATEAAVVLERCFDLAGSRLQLMLQGSEGSDANKVTRTYDLGGFLLEGATGDPDQQRCEYMSLRAASGAAQAAVRAAEEETRRILATRQRQDQGTLVETAFYYANRAKVEDSDNIEAVDDDEEDAYDFLHHFMPSTGARDMTATEAEDARAACLAAFDDRVAERQRVLAARLAESSAEVARLGAVLSSELQHLSPADQARVQQEEALAAFRLHVVKRRTAEHPIQAEARRRELDARLAADKRLMAALAEGN